MFVKHIYVLAYTAATTETLIAAIEVSNVLLKSTLSNTIANSQWKLIASQIFLTVILLQKISYNLFSRVNFSI